MYDVIEIKGTDDDEGHSSSDPKHARRPDMVSAIGSRFAKPVNRRRATFIGQNAYAAELATARKAFDDSQAVKMHGGTLGGSRVFLGDHQAATDQIQCDVSPTVILKNPGDVARARQGSATPIRDAMFLTAGRRSDQTGGCRELSHLDGIARSIPSAEIATDLRVRIVDDRLRAPLDSGVSRHEPDARGLGDGRGNHPICQIRFLEVRTSQPIGEALSGRLSAEARAEGPARLRGVKGYGTWRWQARQDRQDRPIRADRSRNDPEAPCPADAGATRSGTRVRRPCNGFLAKEVWQ